MSKTKEVGEYGRYWAIDTLSKEELKKTYPTSDNGGQAGMTNNSLFTPCPTCEKLTEKNNRLLSLSRSWSAKYDREVKKVDLAKESLEKISGVLREYGINPITKMLITEADETRKKISV